jgi:hypothetical protein
MTTDEISAIRSRYLGVDKKKRKIRKMSDKKFVFDWDDQDDTFNDVSTVASALAATPGLASRLALLCLVAGILLAWMMAESKKLTPQIDMPTQSRGGELRKEVGMTVIGPTRNFTRCVTVIGASFVKISALQLEVRPGYTHTPCQTLTRRFRWSDTFASSILGGVSAPADNIRSDREGRIQGSISDPAASHSNRPTES